MKKLISTLTFLFLFAASHYAQDNNCLDLDGIDDRVQVNDFVLSDDFTISFWFKCKETSNVNFEERMLSFGPSTRLEIGIDSGTNQLWIFDQDGSGTETYGPDLRDEAWHHVALVRSSVTRTVYLDGNLMGTFNGSATGSYDNFCRIGAWTGAVATTTFFNGQMDETSIWSVAKSAAELAEIMSCPISDPSDEDDLLVYWTYDQGTAGGNNSGETTLIDYSLNDIEGTLFNFDLAGNNSNWIAADNASLFYLDASLTQDGNDLMADAAGLNYQWLDCDDNFAAINNETNQTFTAMASGSYAVEVSNESCAVVSDCEDVLFVRVDNLEEESGWSVYPNPATAVLFIEADFLTEVNISVTDVYGKLLLQKTANSLLTDIDLSDFLAGTYFVQIRDKERTLVRKFVVE